MDTLTADTFEEARRQLFDPTVEDGDIRLAEARIQRAEEIRSVARLTSSDPKSLQRLEKTLGDRIKSQQKWIRTLKEIQGVKVKRQDGFRKMAR